MADENVSQTARHFCADDARSMVRNTAQAIGIMRAVRLAAAAQKDRAVIYPENDCSRWGPAVDAASEKLHHVRDAVMETVNAHSADWWTSLCVLEAMGAALWHCDSPGEDVSPMTLDELQSVADAAIESLEALHEQCLKIASNFAPKPALSEC